MSSLTAASRFTPNDEWFRLPPDLEVSESPGIAVNSRDEVYVLTRTPANPILVFDASGNFVKTFGEGIFSNRTHGISIGPDDTVWCADDATHTITKFSADGELLLTLGEPGNPAERWSGAPFCRPTNAAVSPATGHIFVTDGYANSRVHEYTAEGDHLGSWGEPGVDAGQFIIPHDLLIDHNEQLFVADRECHRIQVFEPDGTFVRMISNVHRPDAIALGPDGLLYVAELSAAVSVVNDAPGLGHRVSVIDPASGDTVERFGAPEEGDGPGQFVAPHGIAVNSRGDVFVAEIGWTIRGQYADPPRRDLRSMRMLTVG